MTAGLLIALGFAIIWGVLLLAKHYGERKEMDNRWKEHIRRNYGRSDKLP